MTSTLIQKSLAALISEYRKGCSCASPGKPEECHACTAAFINALESAITKQKEITMNAKKHLDLLGMKVADRVTGFKGVVSSISFDLYGCVQAIVNPGLGKDGKLQEQNWFDVSRLEVVGSKPVMERPNFELGPVAEGKQGAAEKPAMNKV